MLTFCSNVHMLTIRSQVLGMVGINSYFIKNYAYSENFVLWYFSESCSKCLIVQIFSNFGGLDKLRVMFLSWAPVKWAAVSAPVYFSSFVHRKESKMSQSRTFHPIWANWSTFPSFWTAASQKMQELYLSPRCQDLYQDSPRCLVKVWTSYF